MQVSYVVGSAGPTILMSTDQRPALAAVKAALLQLAQTQAPHAISIRSVGGVQLRNLEEFTLHRVRPSERVRPTIHVTGSGHAGPSIRWIGDDGDWISRALLLDGLLDAQGGGHQYLNGYGSLEPIEVEV